MHHGLISLGLMLLLGVCGGASCFIKRSLAYRDRQYFPISHPLGRLTIQSPTLSLHSVPAKTWKRAMTVAPAACLRTGTRWSFPVDRTERKDRQAAQHCFPPVAKTAPAVCLPCPGAAETGTAGRGQPGSLGLGASQPRGSWRPISASILTRRPLYLCLSVRFPQGRQSPWVRAPP